MKTIKNKLDPYRIGADSILIKQGWKVLACNSTDNVIYGRGTERIFYKIIDGNIEKLDFRGYLKLGSGKK